MARDRTTSKVIRFPITVRQAQKLVSRGGYYLNPLAELLGLDDWGWDKKDLLAGLARLAARLGPDYVIEGPNHPLGQNKETQGKDGGSGENFSTPASSEAGPAAANREQGCLGNGSYAADSSRLETGEHSTSRDELCGGDSQNPAHEVVDSSSTALEEGDVLVGNTDFSSTELLRDADGAETQAPPNRDGDTKPNNLGVPPRKWGKSFKASRQACDQFGGVYASLAKVGVDPALVNLARRRLAALVADTAQDVGPRYDYPEFCARLLTYRSPQRARKEEVGRPILWVLADVSGSCESFAWPALQVAKACSKLGVPGADVVAVAHSNGYPASWECNGRPIPTKLPEARWRSDILPWFRALARLYPPQVIIALGDCDALDVYRELVLLPGVERLLWLDNYNCSRGPQDQTDWALQKLGPRLRGKVRYVEGCKGAFEFVEQIR